MAFKMEENNVFFIAIAITVTAFHLVATQNIDCNGKAFHCVNSTHFKICVDLGGGISTTVDDFVIPCPRNTVCKGSNYFECEYTQTTTLKSTQKSEVPNDTSVTPSLNNIDIPTTFYNKTSENKLSEIVMSSIPSSTLEFIDLTTESALQNITSDFSGSDKYRLRDTTIGEASTANEPTPTIFAKVTLDSIDHNYKVKINVKPIEYNNTTGKAIRNELSNSSLSKSFSEGYKISDIENSTSTLIDFSPNYNAKNEKDYENQNTEQLPVTVDKSTIFDGFTNMSPIEYSTEIDQSSYKTEYFRNGEPIESENTSLSYNKASNQSISLNNINNLTETEAIPLSSDKSHNFINITTDETNNLKYKKISVQKVNNTDLVEIGKIIIDPNIRLRVLDNWAISEVYENKANNESPKTLSDISKAVKYTATDRNIFYNPATVTAEAENLITEKIDNTINDLHNIKNSTSWLNNNTTEVPNLNYTTVDLLQNTKKSTLNDVKVLKNVVSPDEQLLTTEASNSIPNLNLPSQFEHEVTTKDSLLLEHINNTLSENNFANVSLSTTSLKLEEKYNIEIYRDISYATEPSPKLEEISSQKNFMGVINTGSTKMTDIYTSMTDENKYTTETFYKYEHSIEPTTVEDRLKSEVFISLKDTTTNNNYEKTIVPNNTFISNEKIVNKSEKLSTTEAAFYSLSSNESVQDNKKHFIGTSTLEPIKIIKNNFEDLNQFGNTTVQDVESKNNITNNEIDLQTVNYNNIFDDAANLTTTNMIAAKNDININQSIPNLSSNTIVITQMYNNTAAPDIISENSKNKMSDGVFKHSNIQIFQQDTENIENRIPQMFTTTEKEGINGYKVTEKNINIYGGTSDRIENSVSAPTSSRINITKENNTQILTYFNNTEHKNLHSIDNNENTQIFNNLKITTSKYTTPFMDTTASIFSVTSGTEITTEMYYSTEFISSQQMMNDMTVNNNDITEIVTLKNSEIINLNVSAEIVLPIENMNMEISKNASENVETNKGTLINVIGNVSVDQNSVTNNQSFNKTKILENSSTHNENTTADINTVQKILKETSNISLLENFNNTVATVTDIPSYYNNDSKEKIVNNNADVKLHYNKDNKEIVYNSYKIEARAMHSNDNINVVNVNVSNHFNKQISDNSSFKEVDINVQNNNNGKIKDDEMKLIEIEDRIKRDQITNEKNNNTTQTNGYAETKEIELIDDITVVYDSSMITSGLINKYNKTIINESKLITNNTLLDKVANILANNTTSMPEQHRNNDSTNNGDNNASKSNKTFVNGFDNKNVNMNTDNVNVTEITTTKVRLTLPQFNITDISHQDTRNESINIENSENKTNKMIPYYTVIQKMSVINASKLDIPSPNDTDIGIKTSKNDVREANKQTNLKTISADQKLQLINGEVRADNFPAATSVGAATFTKNITWAPMFSSHTIKNSYHQNINETIGNESFNKSPVLHASSSNKNLTVNLERSSNTSVLHNPETNNSITYKNVLDILTVTQPWNFTTDYINIATSSLKYDSVSQQNLSVTSQLDDSRSFPIESKISSTTSTNIIRDDLLYTKLTSLLIKDNANTPQIPETVGYDFTTTPYEEKSEVTHSLRDIININEKVDLNENLYTNERQTKAAPAVTTPNVKQISAIQPADILKPITCKIRSHGKYPDENDCNKFYICMGKQSPVIGKCPVGTVFSDIKKQCTNHLSHCIRNHQFKCLAEGRFVDVMSNDFYYICAKNKRGFVRFKLKCQEGYYLNRNTVHCLSKDTFEEDSKNTSESRTKESVSSETSKFTKKFICVNEGRFEFPEDCRKYYVCTKKSSIFRRRLKQCESDEVFDRDRKKCVDDESYECTVY